MKSEVLHIHLRHAVMEDAKMVFTWRNDPFIMSHGSLQKNVTWDEHIQWFSESVTKDKRKIFIITKNSQAIGQVRFDRHDDLTGIISVYLTKPFTGKGYGVDAICSGCMEISRTWNINQIIAHVRSDNANAYSAFSKAGFVKVSNSGNCPENHYELVFSIPSTVPHNRLTFGNEEITAVTEVVASGYWACGPKVGQLEKELSLRAKRDYAVCVGSGFSALRLSLLALGVKAGDTVIIPAYSCVALANAVLATGAEPIPVDIIPGEWNIDPASASIAKNADTKAIIAVHTFGKPAQIEKLRSLGIPVIEDCAHGFGIEIKSKILGESGDISICSFYATKLIGGGTGGAVLTDRRNIFEFIKKWRDYTDQEPCPTRFNDIMNDMGAALVLTQLQRLSSMIDRRKSIALQYNELLRPLSESTGTFLLPDIHHDRIWYRYVIELISTDSDTFINELKKYNITGERPVANWHTKDIKSSCPVSDSAYQHLVSLPIYPTLTEQEQLRVCKAIKSIQ